MALPKVVSVLSPSTLMPSAWRLHGPAGVHGRGVKLILTASRDWRARRRVTNAGRQRLRIESMNAKAGRGWRQRHEQQRRTCDHRSQDTAGFAWHDRTSASCVDFQSLVASGGQRFKAVRSLRREWHTGSDRFGTFLQSRFGPDRDLIREIGQCPSPRFRAQFLDDAFEVVGRMELGAKAAVHSRDPGAFPSPAGKKFALPSATRRKACG